MSLDCQGKGGKIISQIRGFLAKIYRRLPPHQNEKESCGSKQKGTFRTPGLETGSESATFMVSFPNETGVNQKNRPCGRGGHLENYCLNLSIE